ncbi:MAG: hypothetical protein ING75_17200 [Rhodocyclaceae bacterium]|jgi:hypothetical protein|nr:hypothetical protein [Rhodocyclaceae bacterium]
MSTTDLMASNAMAEDDDFPTVTDPLVPWDQLSKEEQDEINREIEEAVASGEIRRFPNFNPVEFAKTLTVARPVPIAETNA